MHLASSIFMMATTKFVPGYDDLTEMKDEGTSRKRRISPVKGREEKSVPASKQSIATPKKALTLVKENRNSPNPSINSILNHNYPRFTQVGSNFKEKSKLH